MEGEREIRRNDFHFHVPKHKHKCTRHTQLENFFQPSSACPGFDLESVPNAFSRHCCNYYWCSYYYYWCSYDYCYFDFDFDFEGH